MSLRGWKKEKKCGSPLLWEETRLFTPDYVTPFPAPHSHKGLKGHSLQHLLPPPVVSSFHISESHLVLRSSVCALVVCTPLSLTWQRGPLVINGVEGLSTVQASLLASCIFWGKLADWFYTPKPLIPQCLKGAGLPLAHGWIVRLGEKIHPKHTHRPVCGKHTL